jgi:hypothetical protein
MPLLPPSTNAQYDGRPVAARLLAVFALLTIVPGCIHQFLPDGGAGTIAGIDLGACGPAIVALFAWAGATQIAFGLAMLVVALRHRPLAPAMLALLLMERTLHALNAWAWKPGGGRHPPEHYAVLVVLPLILWALAASLRPAVASPGTDR